MSASSSPVPALPDPESSFESYPETSASDDASLSSLPWGKMLVFALMIVGGVVVGMLIGDTLAGMDLGGWTLANVLLLVVGLPTVMLLMVAFHEGGHSLAGYLAGFRLQHVSVGPLKLQLTPDGWKASRSQHGFFVGMSHSVPGPSLQDTTTSTIRRRRAVRLAGGAVANVITGGLALSLALALPIGSEAMEAGVRFFGYLSMVMGVTNLIPFRMGSGLITDGAQLIPLLRATPEAERDVALAMVRAEAYGGARPSEWSVRWVEEMLTPRDHGMIDGSTRMLAYRHALDAGRTEEAGEHLAEALDLLDRLPKAQHGGLMVEAAYFEAAHRDNAERARAWLERVDRGSDGLPAGVPACASGRAEAAALLAEGKDDEAQRRIAEAESALSERPAPGTAIAERAWLRDLATTVYLTDDAHSPERPDQRGGAQHERRHEKKT